MNEENNIPESETATNVPVEGTQIPEAQKRIENFVNAYGALVKEYGIDFATYPMFVPDGTGSFKIIVQNQPIDIKNQPVRSHEEFIPKG